MGRFSIFLATLICIFHEKREGNQSFSICIFVSYPPCKLNTPLLLKKLFLTEPSPFRISLPFLASDSSSPPSLFFLFLALSFALAAPSSVFAVVFAGFFAGFFSEFAELIAKAFYFDLQLHLLHVKYLSEHINPSFFLLSHRKYSLNSFLFISFWFPFWFSFPLQMSLIDLLIKFS